MISNTWYFREFTKGVAEALTPGDWAKIYKVLKVGLETLLVEAPEKVNGLNDAFRLGLHCGHAMRKAMFDG